MASERFDKFPRAREMSQDLEGGRTLMIRAMDNGRVNVLVITETGAVAGEEVMDPDLYMNTQFLDRLCNFVGGRKPTYRDWEWIRHQAMEAKKGARGLQDEEGEGQGDDLGEGLPEPPSSPLLPSGGGDDEDGMPF